jgi:hypothetical protein
MGISDGDISVIIAGLIMAAIVVTLGVLGLKNFSKKNKLNQEKDERLYAIDQEISRLKSDVSLQWLPPQYLNTYAYNTIYTYVVNNRVRNFQEALNLYETEMHRARLEMIAASNNNIY